MEPTNNQWLSGITRMHLLYIIHRLLMELNFPETCHEFEREYAIYFDMTYFLELISGGAWDELEHYLEGFTTIQSNDFSRKLFLEIRKQKYLEALERREPERANAILQADLSDILGVHNPLLDAFRSLQFFDNFRHHVNLCAWVNVPTSRSIMVQQLPEVVRANPDLNGKLVLPRVDGRLADLARQSLEAQFSRCQCPRDVWSLLENHRCPQQSGPAPPAHQTPPAPRPPPASDPLVHTTDPCQVRTLKLPASPGPERIHKLMFTKSASSLIALAGSGDHMIWQWEPSASVRNMPVLVRPTDKIKLINDKAVEGQLREPSHCFDLTRTDKFIVSASGRNINFYSVNKFKKNDHKVEKSATSLASSPQDMNLLAIGTDESRIGKGDSKIEILRMNTDVVENVFEKGHRGRVTSLLFSQSGNLLVSGGSDAQVIVWDLENSSKARSAYLHIPTGLPIVRQNTRVQLHEDGFRILAVHESSLAIFDIMTLECLMKWTLPVSCAALSDATFSSQSERIFAGAEDGSVWVFDTSTMLPRHHIAPQAYQTSNDSTSDRIIYPSALAAHPGNRDLVALGMSDGQVMLLELADTERELAEALLGLASFERVSAEDRNRQTS